MGVLSKNSTRGADGSDGTDVAAAARRRCGSVTVLSCSANSWRAASSRSAWTRSSSKLALSL